MVNLRNAFENIFPTFSQAVTVMDGKIQKFTDAANVFTFNLLVCSNECELGQGSNKQWPDVGHLKISTDSNGMNKPLKA